VTTKDQVLAKIAARELTIGVVGLGYVGLPLAIAFVEAGFRVVGYEADPIRRSKIKAGLPAVDDVSPDRLHWALAHGLEIRGRLSPENREPAMCDGFVICVPTPLRFEQDPDTSVIERVVDAIDPQQGTIVALVSTTYPGTTSDVVAAPLIGHYIQDVEGVRPYQLGVDLFVGHAPERVDPGRRIDQFHVPRVVGGETPACGEVLEALFATVHDVVHPVHDSRTAEMAKLLENTYRSVNIALANEVAAMCHALKIDSREVIDAAATKPYGFTPFYPGPGVGGHCIPIDPRYLEHKMRQAGYFSPMIASAQRVNAGMPVYVAGRAAGMLNRAGIAVNGALIHVLGVAYKPDVSDHRESPALRIIEWLLAHGADVSYHDPHVPQISINGYELRSTPTAAEPCDLLLIATAHSIVDHFAAADAATMTFDASVRGVVPLGPDVEHL
jgi:UDP-N-acetyl-D-glucosamine dehydrogenase